MKKLDHLTSSYYFPENILFLVQIQLLREHKEKKFNVSTYAIRGGFISMTRALFSFFGYLATSFGFT